MMSKVAALIVSAFVVDGQPVSKVGVHITQPRLTPQQRSQQAFGPSRYQPAAPLSFRGQQERVAVGYSSSHNPIQTRLHAEAAEAAKGPEYINIYDEELEKCIDGDFCTYRSATMAAHDICVGVRTASSVESVGKSWGAGPMEPECDSILGFGSRSGERPSKTRGFFLIPNCKALPAGVLDSAFSTEAMKGERLYVEKYSVGLGGIKDEGTARLKTATGADYMSRATKNFRKAIATICDVCAAEAPNAKAKETLEKYCASMNALVGPPTAAAEQDENEGVSALTLILTGLVSAFVGAGATLAMFGFRSTRDAAAEEPFLSA